MKKTVLMCLFSALLGALVATAWTDFGPGLHLKAQDSASPGGLRTPAPALTPPVRTAPPGGAEFRSTLGVPIQAHSPITHAQADDGLTPEERTNIAVYDLVNRSVVNINTRTVRPDVFFMLAAPAEGAGSGSVLDTQGHILTNYHVIEGAREIRATLFNGESFEATLVGQDPPNDIAVLKINAPAEMLVPVTPGDSSPLRVGQKVYALGNPFGLERTLTVGIISSLNRSLPSRSGRTMKSIIQIDAALNRGNSGGPLLDSRGRLIGMNTAIASSTGENTGVGFAIPVNTIRRVVPELIRNGRVIRPDIGITRVYESDKGLLIAATSSGGPAERAGLQGFKIVKEQKRRGPFLYEETRIDRTTADMIVSLQGHNIRTADDLLSAIDLHRPGEQVTLGIVRDGREISVPVQLSAGE